MTPPKRSHPPALGPAAEFALFVEDVPTARAFYQDVLGLEPVQEDERGCLLPIPGNQLLLLVKRGVPRALETPGGTIPATDASGRMHVAFRIEPGARKAWARWLARHDVEVEAVDWRKVKEREDAGWSLYVRDPDGHLVELVTEPEVLWGV